MAPVPDPSSSSKTATDAIAEEFGANDWLIEEMYEQYVADPGSVDPSWATYFKNHGLGAGSNGAAAATSAAPAQATPAGATGAAKPSAAAKTAGAPAPSRPAPSQSAPSQSTAAARRQSSPAPAASPAPVRSAAPAQAAPRRQATVEQPTTNKNARPMAPGRRGGVPADPPNPSNRPTVETTCVGRWSVV